MPDFDYDKLVQAIVLALKQHDLDKREKDLELREKEALREEVARVDKIHNAREGGGEWYRQASENAVREVKRILSND